MNLIASDKPLLYSEIFYSPQGEGEYTGVPTVWVRFFLCNLQCDGFGQPDPTDPSTYELPYKDFDLSGITRVEDLPVFERGCDSSYSWSKKFKKLMKKGTAKEIADKIRELMVSDLNPEGAFLNPFSGQRAHLAFTGGEPMMQQDAILDILECLKVNGDLVHQVTIETNGTQKLSERFKKYDGYEEIFMSVSPKLFHVSGESNKKAICPDILGEYARWFNGQLKFVLSPCPRAWEELLVVLGDIREEGNEWPVWIMPVGATDAGQAVSAGDVAKKALTYGFNISARAHIQLFGNVVGS